MKRVIAVLLTLSILMSLCSNVLADTLRLPGSLKRIEEEAFYGDASLDEVEIPNGVQEIGPRAFAQSGVTRISIPSSVITIAGDAFENAANVTIYSEDNAYAHEYSDLHGIPWVNTEGTPDLRIGDLELSPVSLDGVTDEEDIAAIEFYNSHLNEIETAFVDYNNAVDGFSNATQQCSGFFNENIQGIGEDSVLISDLFAFNGLSMLSDLNACTVDEPVFVGEALQFKCTGNTGDFYLIFDGSAMTFSGSGAIQPRGSANNDVDWQRKTLDLLSRVHQIIDPMKLLLMELKVNSHWLEVSSGVAYDVVSESTRSGKLKGPTFGPLYNAGQTCAKAGKIVSGIGGIVTIIDIINTISIWEEKLLKLSDILDHGHLTNAESTNEDAIETWNKMQSLKKEVYNQSYVQVGIIIMQAVMEWKKIADKIGVFIGGGSPFSVVAALSLLADMGISLTIEAVSSLNSLFAELKVKWFIEYDAALHGYISGRVCDNFTLERLEGVMVTCNGLTVLTDSNGEYSISLNDSSITSAEICFRKLGYTTKRETVEISRKYYGTLGYCSMYPYVEVSGTTYAKEEDNLATPPLSGVDIYLLDEGERIYRTQSDDRGNYTAMVPCGAFTLVFEKQGYSSVTKTYSSKADGSNNANKNATLTRDGTPTATPGTPTPTPTSTLPPTPTPYIDPYTASDPTIVGGLVPIDAAHFPDPVFRNFAAQFDGEEYYYFDENGNIKSGILKDGCLSGNERKEITYINFANSSLVSLQGINYFFNLETLYCNNNQLTGLDVSGCANLKYLDCYDNQLTSLNVTGCVNLETLNCGYYEDNGTGDENGFITYDETETNLHHGNQLTSLDVSSCVNLKTLQCEFNQLANVNVSGCKELESLDVGTNQLTSLDISDCKRLISLNCNLNKISSLNVSECTRLKWVLCWENQLTSLNVSGCANLEMLECQMNQLTSLDVSGLANLTKLKCHSNQITILDVSGLANLTELYCVNNPLTYLNASCCNLSSLYLTGCTDLEYLFCYDNQITSLDVSDFTNLIGLYCGSNPLTYFDLTGCTNLETLMCWNNQLTSLNVSDFTNLTELYCVNNPLTYLNASGCNLTSLDVSGCTDLETLYCWNNQLTNLDVSGCINLLDLQCDNNQLINLDVTACSDINEIWCPGNQLTNLDVSGCTNRAFLSCSNNLLTSLNVNGCTSLEKLYCYDNQLTNLDLTGCENLVVLSCGYTDENDVVHSNQLTSLDVSDCASLTGLYCANNQINSLDVSDLESLTVLYCYNNPLDFLDASGCVSLSDVYWGVDAKNVNVSGCTSLETLYCNDGQLTSLNVSGCTNLTLLNCVDNQLTSLDVSGCVNLAELYCGYLNGDENTAHGNLLTSLDVSGCVNLVELWCAYNRIASLNVSGCTKLSRLCCYVNQLTTLDISDCTNLTVLACAINQLTNLDVTNCTGLVYLECTDNQIERLDLTGCPNLAEEDLRCDDEVEVIR